MITTTTLVCRHASIANGLLDVQMAGPAELLLGVRGGLLTFAIAIIVDLSPEELGTTPEVRFSVGGIRDGGTGMDRVKLTAVEMDGDGDEFGAILGDAAVIPGAPELGQLGSARLFVAFNFVDQTLPVGDYAVATQVNGSPSSVATFRVSD